MSTATRVPETITISGDELSVDDAVTTLRRYGRWKLVKNSFIRFRYADGFSHARALALQICLCFIPLVIAVVGLASALNHQELARVVTRTLSRVLPGRDDGDMMQEAAQHSSDQGASGGQLALWLGLIAAIVALTTAMGQIERGANRIYGIERDRPALRKYTRALLMALTAGLLSLLGFLVIIAGNALGESLAMVYGWSETSETLWRIGRWPIGVILAWASFTVVLERAPRRKQPGYSWLAVGSGVSLALWLMLTGLLALYVAKGASFGTTYGPLTGIFALLLWANLSSVALFLGIAFAAQLEAVRAGVPAPVPADPLMTEGSSGTVTAQSEPPPKPRTGKAFDGHRDGLSATASVADGQPAPTRKG
ncbi:YihY/virulence factor BrkB family protein [Mycobacterium sp. LTG2003]